MAALRLCHAAASAFGTQVLPFKNALPADDADDVMTFFISTDMSDLQLHLCCAWFCLWQQPDGVPERTIAHYIRVAAHSQLFSDMSDSMLPIALSETESVLRTKYTFIFKEFVFSKCTV